MLTTKEINFWDKLIERSRDLDLIRRFYQRIGKPEKVKENLSKAVRDLSNYGGLLQDKFEQGVYKPELSDEEVKAIATETVKDDFKRGELGNLFRKLQYPVYQSATFSDEEMGGLVNKVLKEGAQGYNPGNDPKEFSEGLIECPFNHECPEEVGFTYWLVNNKKYQRFVRPELGKNIVTLKIFHELLKWNFEDASQIRQEHPQFYDEQLLQNMIIGLENHNAFSDPENKRTYGIHYLVLAQKSEFSGLFTEGIEKRIREREEEIDKYVREHPTEVKKGMDLEKGKQGCLEPLRRIILAKRIYEYIAGISDETTEEMDRAVSKLRKGTVKRDYSRRKGLPYNEREAKPEDDLIRAFKECEDDFSGSIVGPISLTRLLQDRDYITKIGEKNFQEIAKEKIRGLLKKGKANAIYSILYGTNMGHGEKLSGVEKLTQCVSVDKTKLLEKMVQKIKWEPQHLLSDKYDFSCDNLTFAGTSQVDNAYELYQTIQKEGGKLPSAKTMNKLVFLKMAMHVKEHYEGKGMKTVVNVFENPANSEYINPTQTRMLLTKVFTDYWGKCRTDGFMGEEAVPYFYSLASSKLGELVRNDPRLVPYFKLHQFIESK